MPIRDIEGVKTYHAWGIRVEEAAKPGGVYHYRARHPLHGYVPHLGAVRDLGGWEHGAHYEATTGDGRMTRRFATREQAVRWLILRRRPVVLTVSQREREGHRPNYVTSWRGTGQTMPVSTPLRLSHAMAVRDADATARRMYARSVGRG